MAQTGWTRSIARTADDSASVGTDIGASITTGASQGGQMSGVRSGRGGSHGGIDGRFGVVSSDRGATSESAEATLDVVNYDVRAAIASAKWAAARSQSPEQSLTGALSEQLLGPQGLRNRYLGQADSSRGTAGISAPLTSVEQSSILSASRFSNDLAHGPFDGDPTFKKSADE